MSSLTSDPRVQETIAATIASNAESAAEIAALNRSGEPFDTDPWKHGEHGFPLGRQQGDMLYLLARAIGARRVVEFASSIGVSSLHLAAAIRDNGGGLLIGAELIPDKVRRNREGLEAAGLSEFADIREGDATQTLRDVEGPLDLVLIDGWPDEESPSLDRRVLELLAPKLRVGGIVYDDNGEADVREFLAAGGFHLADLPYADRRGGRGVLAVKVEG